MPEYGNTEYTFIYKKISRSYGFNCGNCHPEDSSRHRDGSVDIELYRESSSNLKKMNRKNAMFDTVKKTCSGVYCHSSGTRNSFIEYKETPSWGSSFGEFRCQSCHGTPPSYKSKKGRENSHFNVEQGSGHLLGIHWDSTGGHTEKSFLENLSSNMGCSTCHFNTVAYDRDTTFVDGTYGIFTCSRCHDENEINGKNRPGTIFNKALHINGIAEVSFKPDKFRTTAQLVEAPRGWIRKGQKGESSSYDETVSPLNSARYIPEEKKCLNVACHLFDIEVRWGESKGCDSCHGNFSSMDDIHQNP
jgi:predicted CxxxxCH...CXXCH cytochrome family protein